jgi:hypothetical protein
MIVNRNCKEGCSHLKAKNHFPYNGKIDEVFDLLQTNVITPECVDIMLRGLGYDGSIGDERPVQL